MEVPQIPDLSSEKRLHGTITQVVFCGTAVGNRSAEVKAYYGDRRNQFWAVLYRVGLTPRVLQPVEYERLLDYGIGLTDIVKNVYGNDDVLSRFL